MTVAEMIKTLSSLPQDMGVYVEIEESGIWEVFPDMVKVGDDLSADGNTSTKVIIS